MPQSGCRNEGDGTVVVKPRTGSRHAGLRLTPAAIPDRAIGVYFALFPVVVAAFLSLQAVRAHSAERLDRPATHPAAMEDIAL